MNTISNQISRLAETIKTVGLIPEIQEQLEELTEQRQKLEAEKPLIDRTDSPLDLEGVVNVEKDLLDTDSQKLSSLLQSVAQGEIFYQDEVVCEYKGYDRKTNTYICVIDNEKLESTTNSGIKK